MTPLSRRHAVLGAWAVTFLANSALAADSFLQSAVEAPTRSDKFRARDGARHPAAELAFFGVKPRSNVVEIWPGGGYWTQILAPALHARGAYTLATGAPDGDKEEAYFALSPGFRQMLDQHPDVYGRVKLTVFGAHHPDLAPPDSADVVLTFRNLHNWMATGDAPQMLAAIRRALKPGGILGIEDHRANTRTPQDPKAATGYVRQDYATALIEKAGFKLVGSSEIDANTRDTADWPKGVWTLPPVLALGQVDRAKYLAIGEADNFVLKFRKVGR
ncbi:class I SAM-dependent methyltransferase [Lichenicoccus sp.]|uniref:class I SAM-dependent methyltransferase n=1 Tax=Lichenicoccus sp. TaxID=2781899 RepID=UPI003D1343E5